MSRGCFITFEGLDGSGKSTQIEKLKGILEAEGREVILTREPGGTDIGEKIRGIILDPSNTEMADMTEAYLYAAARAQLVRQLIQPALSEGKIVICDRFVDSSVAYQGFGRMMGESVKLLNSFAVDDCVPDITFLLRLKPQGGHARIAGRELDRIELEGMDFHQRTFEGYEKIASDEKDRVVVVDASGSIDEIHEVIRDKVRDFL